MSDGNPLSGESTAAVVENAGERQFGPEFEDIHILSNAQVAVILQVSARSAVSRDEELNDVYKKTQKYVERFNTMTNPEKDHQELVEELDNLQEYVLRKWANNMVILFCFPPAKETRSNNHNYSCVFSFVTMQCTNIIP